MPLVRATLRNAYRGCALGVGFLFACSVQPRPTASQSESGGSPRGHADARPTVSEARVIVPSNLMPVEVRSQKAHNNLDIIRHESRLFFAFRTAPDHFAHRDAHLYVVSSLDERNWRFEGVFHVGRDLREPRFLSVNGRLSLFYAVLGTDRTNFQPGRTYRVEYLGPGRWSAPEERFTDGFVPWRFVVHDGVAYVMGYVENGSLYSTEMSNIEVHWMRSTDGREWRNVSALGSVIMVGGVSETAFTFLSDGDVITVGRNEGGAEGGFGARICRASAPEYRHWRCENDPRKYDSPLILRHGQSVFLVGRRNVTDTGHYDQGGEGDLVERRWLNQAAYWNTPKRCSIWAVDTDSLSVTFVMDLPTAGDTCFASIVPDGRNDYILYDYRSTTDDMDIGWVVGQSGPTEIYRVRLSFIAP
ncbi:MAG: hypothetical protein VX589_13540 [Myxococcota bacterium]|nr:hypothetical protein [Myxococcota bacterium]